MSELTRIGSNGARRPSILSREEIGEIEALMEEYPDPRAASIEATKGATSYYLISDHGTNPYRNRIRSPSFTHMQMLPLITRGGAIADLLAILGAMDFVLADVDR